MKKINRDKLIRAAGMLQGLSWAVEEKSESVVDAIWFILEDLDEIIDSEEDENDS